MTVRHACNVWLDRTAIFKVKLSVLSCRHCFLSSQTILACFVIALMVHLGKDPIPLLVFYQQIKIETWKSYRISLKKTFLLYTPVYNTNKRPPHSNIYFKILLTLNTLLKKILNTLLERGK